MAIRRKRPHGGHGSLQSIQGQPCNCRRFASGPNQAGPRCKVIPFSEFKRQAHWMADRWWASEERRALGVANEHPAVSDRELQEVVAELQATLAQAGPGPNIEQSPYKEVGLNSWRFELSIGKRLLKKDMMSEGIPAYSANVSKPFGYVAASDLTGFTRPALLWRP